MNTAYLRQLGHHFDPAYIKPGNVSRAVPLLHIPQQTQRELKTSGFPVASETVVAVSTADASNILPCWIPAPHARRIQSRRHTLEDSDWRDAPDTGNDVYA